MKPISYSRFAVFLLVVLELWSSWHFDVKPDATFLAVAVIYMFNNKH